MLSRFADGKNPMHVAVIGSRGLKSEYSGIEFVLKEVCPALVDRGVRVTVFGGEEATTFRGVTLAPVPTVYGKYFETLSRSLAATWRASKSGFDVVHFHDVGPALFAPVAARARIPTLLTLHSLDWQRAKWPGAAQWALKKIERFAIGSADAITVVSRSLGHYVETEYRRASTFIPNVAEPQAQVAPSGVSARFGLRPKGYLLFAARLVPEKAAHELLEAFQSVATDMRLVIAGDGRYDNRYVSGLKAQATGDRVVFTGHLSGNALRELYSNAYLFVLPSHVEGRSMAVLEALAHGTPCLVSDIPENLEIVEEVGFQFQVGNVGSLRSALLRLIESPSEVEDMRHRVVKRFENQPSWEEVAAQYQDVYRALRRGDR